MKTTIWWIRTDFWLQTIVGSCILLSALSIVGFGLALLLLIPFGALQVISGLVQAFRGDRLQQIYLGVVLIYLALGYFLLNSSAPFNAFIPMLLLAAVIGVWKYTVVRADYNSLSFISAPDLEHDDLLDA